MTFKVKMPLKLDNSDYLTTRFRGRLTTNPFFYFMSYTTTSQSFILVNSIRNDMILIPELRWSTTPYSPTTITVDPTAAGTTSVVIPFVTVDNAGGKSVNSGTEGTATLNLSDPLPVSLVSFNAAVEGNTLALTWVTVQEVNNDGFQIERSSDAKNWNNIGFVKAQTDGNSKQELSYRFIDNQPLSGDTYYRLKQFDQDGTFAYSTIRMVRSDGKYNVRAYPIPASDHVKVEGIRAGETITIINLLGQEIQTVKVNGPEHVLNLSRVIPGAYQLLIRDSKGNRITTLKIVVGGK